MFCFFFVFVSASFLVLIVFLTIWLFQIPLTSNHFSWNYSTKNLFTSSLSNNLHFLEYSHFFNFNSSSYSFNFDIFFLILHHTLTNLQASTPQCMTRYTFVNLFLSKANYLQPFLPFHLPLWIFLASLSFFIFYSHLFLCVTFSTQLKSFLTSTLSKRIFFLSTSQNWSGCLQNWSEFSEIITKKILKIEEHI